MELFGGDNGGPVKSSREPTLLQANGRRDALAYLGREVRRLENQVTGTRRRRWRRAFEEPTTISEQVRRAVDEYLARRQKKGGKPVRAD